MIEVKNAAELDAALESASGGETIRLADGDYGALDLNTRYVPNARWAETVTIESENPGNAVFTGMKLRDVKNLSIDGVTFDYEAEAGAPIGKIPFRISGGSDIAIRNSVFDGDLAEGLDPIQDGHGTGKGLVVSRTENVVLQGNEVFDFRHGIVTFDSSNVLIAGNDIHDIRMDGLTFNEVNNVVIEGNWIHDFNIAEGSGDHADMIQFWTTKTTEPSTDIQIRNNLLMAGEGGNTQSIFMRNELIDKGMAGDEMRYRDVLIEDNVIWNAHVNGIVVGASDGLAIRNNTLLQNADAVPEGENAARPLYTPDIRLSALSSDDVVVENNIAQRLWIQHGDPDGWVIEENLWTDPENYVDLFAPDPEWFATGGVGAADLGVSDPGSADLAETDLAVPDQDADPLSALRLLEGGIGASASQPDDTATIASVLDAAIAMDAFWF